MLKKFFIFIFSLIISAGILFGDTYVKKMTHSEGMGKAKDTVSEIWFTNGGAVTRNGDVRIIYKLGENKLYFINDKNKKYAVFTLPIKLPPQMEQMMKMFNLSFNLQKTSERQKIKDWDCTKFIVTSTQSGNSPMKINMKMEIWATDGIKINRDLYEKFNNVLAFSNPMIKKMTEEMKKLNGKYPVKTIITMNVMGKTTSSTSEISEVSYKPAPKTIFQIPSSYQKEVGDFMHVMQKLNK